MSYIFGAPLKKLDRKNFEEAVLKRFENDIERTVAYADKVTDSQIARASGILTSTSILAGMSYFVNARPALFIALLSLVLVATALYVPWPATPYSIGDAQAEFERTCRRIYYRAVCNRICISFIILTILLLGAKLLGY